MRARVTLAIMGSCVAVNGSHPVPVQDSQWQTALAEALAPFAKSQVQAHLGFDHARIAVMTVDQAGGLGSLASAKQASFVHAWAADMLHIQPHEQIIRWRALADARKVLVSCVRRETVEDLELACKQAGAPLESCRPAVLTATESGQASAVDPVTVVWTEGSTIAARHGAIQLLGLAGGHLQRCWRGWLPADEQIDAAVARFETGQVPPGASARVNLHWPASLA